MIRSLLVAALVAAAPAVAAAQDAAKVQRGEYLVNAVGCNDCHTPLKMGPNGPEPDMTRFLSGHPQDFAITAPIALSEPWGAAFAITNTAFSGPWGVSFSANLTPDPTTGVLRDFTEQQFIQTLRTGRHQGQGRSILPPMPWPAFRNFSDDDLGAIYAYLKQITPIANKVPDPIPPAQ